MKFIEKKTGLLSLKVSEGESMTTTAVGIASGNQARCWSSVCEVTSYLQGEQEKELGIARSSETSKTDPSDTRTPTKPYLLILFPKFQQLGNKRSNIENYGSHFSSNPLKEPMPSVLYRDLNVHIVHKLIQIYTYIQIQISLLKIST